MYDVQYEGCRMFENLAVCDENRIVIRQEGGIEAVVCTLTNHKDHLDVRF